MRARVRLRLVILLALAVAALAAGCGGGDDKSSADPASVVPASAPVFVEASLKLQGEAEEDVNELARRIAGIDDIGAFALEQIEASASDSGSSFDFEEDVEPWLGEKGGIWLGSYDGDDFNSAGFAVQSSDDAAAQEFIDKFTEEEGKDAEDASYEGVDYKIEPDEGEVVGLIDGFLVFTEREDDFKAMVDASDGESLAEDADYEDAVGGVPGGSVADVYVDIGALVDESGGIGSEEDEVFLDAFGLAPGEATAVASLVPGSDTLEIDLSTDVTGDRPAGGEAVATLESLPAGSTLAIATSEFGDRFAAAIDRLDANGIPGSIPPNKFKQALKEEIGIDVDALTESIGDVGIFVEGRSERQLTAAMAIEANDAREARNAVSRIGLLLRASGTPGVSALGGGTTGFSVRNPDLGRQPLVVIASGERVVIGYGVATAKAALAGSGGATLGEDPAFKEAKAALGDTPISAYADGPRALDLIGALADDPGFDYVARLYLDKVEWLALGGGSDGDRTTAKLVAGLGK